MTLRPCGEGTHDRAVVHTVGSMKRSLAVIVLLCVAALAGCSVASEPTPRPSFVSDADAGDEAGAVLTDYLAAVSAYAQQGGGDRSLFDGLATPAVVEEEVEGIDERLQRGDHAIGSITFFGYEVQHVEFDEDYPTVFVRIRLCIDWRERQWVNAAGDDATATHRPWAPFEVALVEDPASPDHLLVDEINQWDGHDFRPKPRDRARPAPSN